MSKSSLVLYSVALLVVIIFSAVAYTDYFPQGNSTPVPSPVVLPGTTAGNLRWSQPVQLASYKETVLNFQGYENTGGVAQTVNYTAAYSYGPSLTGSCPAGLDVASDLTKASLPTSMSSTFTGQCFVEGE